MDETAKPASKSFVSIFALPLLLILPAVAAYRGLGPTVSTYAAGAATAISLLTFIIYALDKRSAGKGGQRTPETVLHLLELLGGWPGAFLGQRLLRHKNAKVMYQVAFWFIVAIYQVVAIDWLMGWPMVAALKQAILGNL
jgi:uncharacterized membrane protein YsdA (DUF1294 family)